MVDPGNRLPLGRLMTGFADVICLDVLTRLAGRPHAIVAARAIARDRCVVEAPPRPTGGGVAVIAAVTTLDMIGGLAFGDLAVMTAGAAAGHGTMVDERDRRPLIRVVVTGLASASGRKMAAGHACGTVAVMTARAVAGDRCMVESGACPSVGAMAILAGIGAGNVIGRLARGDRTVMTAGAGTDDRSVVDPRDRRPLIGTIVAVFAHTVGREMACDHARSTVAVMAARAVTSDGSVIEPARQPGIGRMTLLAIVVALDVIG